ncbi:hypothetical protein [Streptomyces nigrescens]|uniref:hypothetical protein n=1 Tax=Streptomyces nigrescens TaxID=1920 RepID=UPI0036FDB7C9
MTTVLLTSEGPLMKLRTSHLAVAVLTCSALCALTACSSSSSSPDTAASSGPSTKQLVTKSAKDFLHAWMAVEPSDGETMCKLQTKAARPNFDEDGGTLHGCITQRQRDSAGDTTDKGNATRAPLSISISNYQDVLASRTHPAGKGVLATMHREGEDQFRYALRVVKDGGQWHIEQKNDVGPRFRHTADPVAAVLADKE